MATAGLDPLLQDLRAATSAKRRSAAKKLRKLGLPEAGPALLEALRAEVRDPRTWETQYQMVMALGECGHGESLPFLRELSKVPRQATMVNVALGDAIVRLARTGSRDAGPILEIMKAGDDMLADGAFRAMAMLRMVPEPKDVSLILMHVGGRSLEDGLRVWVAAAAAGWSGAESRTFLEQCARSPRQDLQRAARASLDGKYERWSPL